MKKLLALLLSLVLLLSLCACTVDPEAKYDEPEEETKLEGLLDITAVYVGEPVTDTHHEFKDEDFKVYAAFSGEEALHQVQGFRYKLDKMADGCYIFDFYYGGCHNQCYVPIDIDFYPGSN